MRTIKNIALTAAIFAFAAQSALADAKTESYVRDNANEVLQALNNPDLSAEQRTAQFNAYMDKFADFDAIARFAIGKYSRRFTPEEMEEYRVAFRDYALAVYQNELDVYRGESVQVNSSIDRSAKDTIVNTTIKRNDGKDMDVLWRVFTRDGEYQVVDVALNIEGNLIWLGIEQRAQYLSILDRSNGSAAELIKVIKRETEQLRQ